MFRLVAESLHPGPRLVARRSGVVARRIRLSLPQAGIVACSSRVHRLRRASLAGVQSPVRPSLSMDMVESEDEPVGCGTWPLNFLHYFLRGPLGVLRVRPAGDFDPLTEGG